MQDYGQPDHFGVNPFDQVDGRHANRQNSYLQLRPRLFNPLNLLFPSYFYSLLSSISSSAFSTVTSYLILNSTVTTSIVTPCVPLAEFKKDEPPNPLTPLTQLCRRRRSAILYGDLTDTEDSDYESWEDQQ